MFEKFTERTRKVLSLARQEAQRLNSEFVGTEHMLLGIIQEGGGRAAKALKNLNVDPKVVRTEIEKLITPSSSPTVTLGQLPFSPRAKRVIELAGEAASQLGHDVIGTEHLLLGLLKENEGIAAKVLTTMGVKFDQIRGMVLEVLGKEGMPPEKDEKHYEVYVYGDHGPTLHLKLPEKPEVVFRSSSDGRVKIEWVENGQKNALYISPLQTFRLSEPEKKKKKDPKEEDEA